MGRFGTSWENSRVKSMLRQGLMRRSKTHRHSITSSASASTVGGIFESIASGLKIDAQLSSNFVGR
jgi:RNA:NAD 2'-phosphotransferase (TPT1/KptA family)